MHSQELALVAMTRNLRRVSVTFMGEFLLCLYTRRRRSQPTNTQHGSIPYRGGCTYTV